MSNLTRIVRTCASALTRTPLHPQWLSFRTKRHARARVRAIARGRLLDIGCADGQLQQHLSRDCEYVGLDYPTTANGLYRTRPNVFGDAGQLPFCAAAFDTIAILDVLEHVPDPQACLREIRRVLKPEGVALIHVPFLYPLHDEPFDFWRLTEHGLHSIAKKSGLRIDTLHHEGAPAETAALLANLALARAVLRASHAFPPAILLGALIAPCIFAANCLGWLLGRVTASDSFMPVAYWLVLSSEADAGGDVQK